MKRIAHRDSDETTRRTTRRALIMGGAMSAVVAVLGARLRYMQVDQADQYRLLAEENRVSIRLIPPNRGQIFDRNGRLIAGNEQNYRIIITREDAGDVNDVLHRLQRVIPLSDEDIARVEDEAKKRSAFVPIIVADRISWDDMARVATNAPSLPGVTPEVGQSRIYPLDTDFAHVVGYVGPVSERDLKAQENPDPLLQIPQFQIGKAGVETWREDVLRGEAGTRRIEVNAVGRIMRELDRVEGQAGADLTLTIDAEVQNFVNARLGGESAAVVAIDVTNGDLLAISSAPSFNPNLFVRGISYKDYSALTGNDHRPLANKAVSGAYPPGSTFKIVTALAALEAGVIDADSTVYCPGYYEYGGRRFHCWSRGGHGHLNLDGALGRSCDVYFYDVSQRVGIDKIAETGRKMGLGQRHDLPMSAIVEGVMPDKAWKMASYSQEWRIGDTINASIGQGYVLASPLQLALMTGRLASGRAIVPRLVRAIDGQEVATEEAPALDIPPSFLRMVRHGMFTVSNKLGMTGYSSRIVDSAMTMAGKSGTAQVRNITAAERARGVISNDQLPWARRDHALFVGFAPYDNPKVAVACVVEHGGGGSTVAAPIVRDVLLRILSGGMPPLAAYPESQRSRIETALSELPLRDFAALAGATGVRGRA
ncbi:penicillin-binding protein 2 [Falsirhodobacter sp. 20TX0035]|uniref:penicillin-binding protein 2 n=1 Tax=Falsirhodobacter sp. 20TX0035 TaxID=3022019 RepID=UPI00232D8858|nr:penicillin-binding protein 2 [Falsirhodobacter sp. 20TX0035]MDB6452199.1 penicillin-binding protein 2 [Falsirhodobacter sp. 20TX0035]